MRNREDVFVVVCVVFMVSWSAAAAAAQPLTRCASCHFANIGTVPTPAYLADWERSAHARHNVGCDACHGGDPWTYEPVEAHRGVLPALDPASPVNRSNLVSTCARCHRSVADTFAMSRHQKLLVLDGAQAPTCATCHGAMTSRVPSPGFVEARCASCHPPGSTRGSYPALMRDAVESLDAIRRRVAALGAAVDRVDDATRRAQLTVGLRGAHRAVGDAAAAVHSWNVQSVGERLDAARRTVADVERAVAGRADR